jgi:translation initiation factor 3 subunit M
MENLLPVFIDIPEKNQAQEICRIMIASGADLQGSSKENIHEELACLLYASDNWLKSACDADLEALMNSFISLIHECTFDGDKLTRKFCSKITDIGANQSNALLRLKILNNLFAGLAEDNILRFDVYLSKVRLAASFSLTKFVQTQMKDVRQWLSQWKVTVEQKGECYRELHAALKSEQSEEATKMLLELLSSYGEECADEAFDDARACVIEYVGKAGVFTMDHLLQLKPIQALKGKPEYQLLDIFVAGTMVDYLAFQSSNQEFIDSSGLVHADCLNKIRILTFLSMASQQTEIPFSECVTKLNVDQDDVEDFVVELIQSGLVHAKIDQIQEKIIIRSCSRRTFKKAEWEELHNKLESWRDNLMNLRNSLEQVVLNNPVSA